MELSTSLELVPVDQPEGAPAAHEAAQEAVQETAQDMAQETVVAIEIVALGASRIKPDATDPATKADRFLREATRQYQEGHLDQPLWDHAFTQANGDHDATVAIYLPARATALRLLDRERRLQATRATLAELDDAAIADTAAANKSQRTERRRSFAMYRYAVFVAAALVPLAVGGWLLSSNRSAGAPVTQSPVVRVQAVAAAPGNDGVSETETRSQAGASLEFKRKVQELSDSGNWHVLVLYAVEWTRKEPANAAAWNQLRAGYVELGQYDDALGAATKAVQLAPEDPRMWRSLGDVHAILDNPSAALRAYEEVAARDRRDVVSLRQIGSMNARLGRVQEAKVAFDHVLAISPNDATTLCLRSSVAQMPVASTDAYGTAKQAKSIDTKCRG
jgi:tetratricopeptide (TPR) repeat protein